MPGRQPGTSRSRSHSRQRSCDRRRSQSRGRYRDRSVFRSILRSVSGKLANGAELGEINTLMTRQQEYIVKLLLAHKSELEAKLQGQSRRFASCQLEKQYQVNLSFKEKVSRIIQAVKKNDKQLALEEAEALVAELECHEEDLIIADTSPHSWLAVAKVRAGTELPKDLRKKLSQVDKDLAAKRPQKNGGYQKKPFRFSQQGQEPFVRQPDR